MGQPICGQCDERIAFHRVNGELVQFPHECDPLDVARTTAAKSVVPPRQPHVHHCPMGGVHAGTCHCVCGAWMENNRWFFAGTPPTFEDELA